VALVYLAASVVGITPISLNIKARVPVNTVARIVGYGYHAAGASPSAGTADTNSVIQKTGIKSMPM